MKHMNCNGLSPISSHPLTGRRHPLTGELLVPLGFRKNGMPIMPFMGGSGEGDEGTNTEGSEKESGSKDKEGSGNSSENNEGDKPKEGEGEGDKPKPGSLEARLAALEDEKERQYTRRKEAETRADKAEEELKALRDKDLPEVDKLRTDVETLTSDNATLNDALVQSRLEIAFLKDNTYNWHNPGRALQVADLTRVEVDKDGTVRGLAEALEALAKSDPYLINEEKPGSDDKKDDKNGEKKDPPKSGSQKNGSEQGKPSSAEKRRAELVDRYPGLRR